jgi:hypothetical protein
MTKIPDNLDDEDFDKWLGDNVVKLPTAKRRPFQNWTDEDIRNQPKLRFLVGDARRPILGEGALWQIYGKKKSAKTLFTMELSFCIAFGLDFYGLPVKQGQVVYLIGEGGIERNYQRFNALWLKYEKQMRAKGYTSLDQARAKTGNLILSDQIIALASDKSNDPFGPKAFLDDMALQKVTAPVFIVVDTWARALWASGGHDSAQEMVGPAVQACDVIRRKLGGATLAMLMHVGAKGTEAKGLTDPVNAIDGAVSCVKTGNGFKDAVFTFTTVSQRHGEEGFVMRAKLAIPEGQPADDVSVTLSGDDDPGALNDMPAASRGWLGALRSLGVGSATVDEWLDAGRRNSVVKGKDGLPPKPDSVRKSLDRASDELVKLGAVAWVGDRVSLTLEKVAQDEAASEFVEDGEDDEGEG